MKSKNIFLICIIVALIFGVIGFVIGVNTSKGTNNEKRFVGTYKTNTWNGKEAVLVLQKDKSMIHPMGYKGTWLVENGKLYIEYEYISTIAQSADEAAAMFNGESIKKDESNYKKHEKKEVTIVEGGLMLSGHFFEKINK